MSVFDYRRFLIIFLLFLLSLGLIRYFQQINEEERAKILQIRFVTGTNLDRGVWLNEYRLTNVSREIRKLTKDSFDFPFFGVLPQAQVAGLNILGRPWVWDDPLNMLLSKSRKAQQLGEIEENGWRLNGVDTTGLDLRTVNSWFEDSGSEPEKPIHLAPGESAWLYVLRGDGNFGVPVPYLKEVK